MLTIRNQTAPIAASKKPVDFTAIQKSIRKKIDALVADNRTNNTTRAVTFSRACGACSSESTEDRYASLACGHAVCRVCADARTICPVCDTTTTFVQLVENGTRECPSCRCAEPLRRGFFSGCGHIQCDACISDAWYHALVSRGRFACSECHQRSRPVKLREQ